MGVFWHSYTGESYSLRKFPGVIQQIVEKFMDLLIEKPNHKLDASLGFTYSDLLKPSTRKM